MANVPVKIQRIIDEGYAFNFGDYISKGFNLFMRNPGLFIGFTLVQMLILMAAGIIPLGSLIIAAPLNIGFFHVAAKLDKGQPVEFGDFFRGFDKFGDLFLTSLLVVLITMAVLIPGLVLLMTTLISAAGSEVIDPYGGPFEAFGDMLSMFTTPLALVGIILIVVPAIYITVSFSAAPLLVWFFDMRPWDAIQASRKAVSKQFWIIMFFGLVISLITGLGIILLLLGLLFTYPAMLCARYAAFAEVTSLHEEDPDQDILDHFAPAE